MSIHALAIIRPNFLILRYGIDTQHTEESIYEKNTYRIHSFYDYDQSVRLFKRL